MRVRWYFRGSRANEGVRRSQCCGLLPWFFISGHFTDHLVRVNIEVDAAGVADGDAEGAEDQTGAAEVDGTADQRVDDFHERGLDGFLALKKCDVMDALVQRFDAVDHALVEVAELFCPKGGGAATDSVDLDVSADFDVWHFDLDPIHYFLVVTS